MPTPINFPISAKTSSLKTITENGKFTVFNEPIPGILIDLSFSIQYTYATPAFQNFPSFVLLTIDSKTKVYDGNYVNALPAANASQGISISQEAKNGAALPNTGALPSGQTVSLVSHLRYQTYAAALYYDSSAAVQVWAQEYMVDEYPYVWNSLYLLQVAITGFPDLSGALVSARLRFYSTSGLGSGS